MNASATQLTLPGLLPPVPPPEEPVLVDPTTFLEAALGRKLRADEARYLVGPVVFYRGTWGETLPGWLREAIPLARVVQLMAEGAGEEPGLASLEEVTAYLYTAALEAPLAQEWADIYFWVGDHVMRAHGMLPKGQTVWDLINPDEAGSNVRELSPYLAELLHRLRRDIRRAVVKHQRQRERETRRRRPGGSEHGERAESLPLLSTKTRRRCTMPDNPKKKNSRRGTYQGYTPDTTDEEARALFAAKYGHPPAEVLRNAGAVLAGPITSRNRA